MTQLRWWLTACALWMIAASPIAAEAPREPACEKESGCCTKEGCCSDKACTVQLSVVLAEVQPGAMRLLELKPSLSENAQNSAVGTYVLCAEERGRLEKKLKWLREKGAAKLLAEPNLITLCGQRGTFMTGGQQPLPIADCKGQKSVQFVEFGTRFNFMPTLVQANKLQLNMEAEVSKLLDAQTAVAGEKVPVCETRRVHTTAELSSGESFAIVTGQSPDGDAKPVQVMVVTPSWPVPAAPALVLDVSRGKATPPVSFAQHPIPLPMPVPVQPGWAAPAVVPARVSEVAQAAFVNRESGLSFENFRMTAKDGRVVLESPMFQATAGSLKMDGNCLLLEGDARFSYRNKHGSRAEVSGGKIVVRLTGGNLDFQVSGAAEVRQ